MSAITWHELILHLTEITRAYDENMTFEAITEAERRFVEQKIIGATAALEGLAVELERAQGAQ